MSRCTSIGKGTKREKQMDGWIAIAIAIYVPESRA